MQCMQDACRAVKGDCRNILMMRADCGASGTLIKINPGLSSILTALHADCMQCMQAACRPVKMKLITPAFDWSFLVFLTLLPTSACFFSSLIWPLFTPWVTGGLYFLLHQNQLHPKIDKINGHLPHTKKPHVIISKLQVTETQKWCRIFYEKEEVHYHEKCASVFFIRSVPSIRLRLLFLSLDANGRVQMTSFSQKVNCCIIFKIPCKQGV